MIKNIMKELIFKTMTHLLVYFPIDVFFVKPITKLTHHKNSSTNSLCRYSSCSSHNNYFSILRQCIITENALQMLQWILYSINIINTWKNDIVFDNNITNYVIAPFSTQFQNNISQKLYHDTIHLNQSWKICIPISQCIYWNTTDHNPHIQLQLE